MHIGPAGMKFRCTQCQHEFLVFVVRRYDPDTLVGQLSQARKVAEEAYLFRKAVSGQLGEA
jgi:hypothetical protein